MREGAAAQVPMFFSYGSGDGGAEQLALLGGSLILDSGEADQSFLFRCQDRFITYAWLLGLRPVLLVADAEHGRAQLEAVVALRDDCGVVAAATGLVGLFRRLEPLILGCDPLNLTLNKLLPLPSLTKHTRIHLNQVSPTAAKLLEGIADILQENGVELTLNRAAMWDDSKRALRLHDKIAAHALAQACPPPAPPQLATAALDPAELAQMKNWEDLLAHYSAATGDGAPHRALMVKSSRDSAGNVAALLDDLEFDQLRRRLLEEVAKALGGQEQEALADVRAAIAASRLEDAAYPDERLASFEAIRRQRREGLQLVVQRAVPPAAPCWDKPAALGLSYYVDAETVQPLAVSAQTYQDAHRRHFRGALLDDRIEGLFLGSDLERQMRCLCTHFQQQGYRGPIGFDALRDEGGSYILIQDCNPRLSAVFPALALRRSLSRGGLRSRFLLSLGYRGEARIPNLHATLAALDAAALLYTSKRRSGLLLLPNMVGPQRCDLYLIDAPLVTLDRAARVLAELGCQADISSEIAGLPAR